MDSCKGYNKEVCRGYNIEVFIKIFGEYSLADCSEDVCLGKGKKNEENGGEKAGIYSKRARCESW